MKTIGKQDGKNKINMTREVEKLQDWSFRIRTRSDWLQNKIRILEIKALKTRRLK